MPEAQEKRGERAPQGTLARGDGACGHTAPQGEQEPVGPLGHGASPEAEAGEMLEGGHGLGGPYRQAPAPVEAPFAARPLERGEARERLVGRAAGAGADGIDRAAARKAVEGLFDAGARGAEVKAEDDGVTAGRRAADELDGALCARAPLIDGASLGRIIQDQVDDVLCVAPAGGAHEAHAGRSLESIHGVGLPGSGRRAAGAALLLSMMQS